MNSSIAASTMLLILASAGGACAQNAPAMSSTPILSAAAAAAPVSAPLNLSLALSGVALTDTQAEALRAGIVRTSLDHRFIDRLTGSFGYLCGLHGPDYDETAAMRGSDSRGKFLGAKLSLSFK